MDPKQHMIIDNNTHEFITTDVASCECVDISKKYYFIKFESKLGIRYKYGINRITWLKNPKIIDPKQYQLFYLGKRLTEIAEIYVFSDNSRNYWYICFQNGYAKEYFQEDLVITKSCLEDNKSKSVFEYLKKMSEYSDIKNNDGEILLAKHYEKLSCFIGDNTALASYLNPNAFINSNETESLSVPIFPFGCNLSQYEAVKTALENNISVIQGPPGTGKTQTILNIIANLLVAGKTIQLVSNNESAILNVLDKLSSPKYGMGFLVALLGKSDNKEKFLKSQTGYYPDLSKWNYRTSTTEEIIGEISECSEKLREIFQQQKELALAKQELQELVVEQQYFDQYTKETEGDLTQHKIRRKLKSKTLMQLWQECQLLSDSEKGITFIFKVKSNIIYGISYWHFYDMEIAKIINMFQSLYYQARVEELTDKIKKIEESLEAQNEKELLDKLTNISMEYMKSVLYKKYGGKGSRCIFNKKDLWKKSAAVQEEYPIILSTTFSSRSSLGKDALYDYVIMDEASQVDIATGALALSSAKNAVIVGDTKQLPNIVKKETKSNSDEIFETFNLEEGYRYSQNSFLKSICSVIPAVPQTLLREHYRCHPKIINFCNYKFYGGELVIMTPDNGERDVISVVKTVEGNHARERTNQRQIDSVIQEVLPQLSYQEKEIGVIAPYRDQVNAFMKPLSKGNIEVDTVHKFQGREKEAIILSTVDNVVTDFSDDPFLINVAVSRAKKHLCLVISGNEQPNDSNIFDLVSYIEYNNFSVTESKIYSIFDYLYKQYTQSRIEYLKKHKRISVYDSENLMYALIVETLKEYDLSYLDVISHLPLHKLLRDTKLLSTNEYSYAMNNATHIDLVIFNRITKKPVLAIEVDGYDYHKEGTKQAERDKMKNHILDLYEVPYERFVTNGSGEKEKLVKRLKELLKL